MNYRFLEHTADVKFQAFGRNLEEIFVNSVLALKESISGKIKIKSTIKKSIKINGENIESLLYNLLEEILYLLDAENFLISEIEEIKINLDMFTLKAVVFGDRADSYKFTNNVKAITYSEMFVKKENSKWVSQIVLDV